jgi:hypothetical protein
MYKEHTDTPAMAYATTCNGIRPTESTQNIATVVPYCRKLKILEGEV